MMQASIDCPVVVRDEGSGLVPDLYRVVRRLRRLSDPQHQDVTTMLLLHRLACAGPTRPSDLAADVQLDLSTVSRHARSLADAGMVSRDPDPQDGRSLLLALTERGAQEMSAAFRRREQLITRATADWDSADVQILGRLLARLADDLDDPDAGPGTAPQSSAHPRPTPFLEEETR
jgi:DNA-binding MarR family transcriptional regulator